MELALCHNKCKKWGDIIVLPSFFNLFNTRSGCKVRKFFVTLRSKRRKMLDREEKRCYQLLRIRLMAIFEIK